MRRRGPNYEAARALAVAIGKIDAAMRVVEQEEQLRRSLYYIEQGERYKEQLQARAVSR